MGVVENHMAHLPLGTDYLIIHKMACMAAQKEPAVVFPPFYFGQVFEATCYPGAIALKPTLLMELMQNVFDEIGRNGFTKIIIYNGHGGNNHFVPFLAQCSLYTETPYQIYVYSSGSLPEVKQKFNEICESELHGHACECETSLMMHGFPELVNTSAIPQTPALPQHRMQDIRGTYTGIWWYADYPDYMAGDPKYASAEKGQALVDLYVETFAKYIARVKADKVIPALNREFFAKARNLGKKEQS
jgi:creatinine amidohydrolase